MKYPDVYGQDSAGNYGLQPGRIYAGRRSADTGELGQQHAGDVVGGHLLSHLRKLAHGPVLIGTWADTVWAIRFYEKHGFHLVAPEQQTRLLQRYWNVPNRQAETSVVLADPTWQGTMRKPRLSFSGVGRHPTGVDLSVNAAPREDLSPTTPRSGPPRAKVRDAD